jgi:hypothetical protein
MALLTVVCTDRGQHPRRRIAFRGNGPGKGGGVLTSQMRRGGARWHCDTCGRTVVLTADNLDRLWDGMRAAGVSQVDMSLIPGA